MKGLYLIAVSLARWLLGGLLIWAGAAKVGHPEALASTIAGFRLLPAWFVAPVAVILPYFELLLGLYLVAGLFTRVAAWVATVQFVIYAGAIASA
ncbi:MAG TPA: MauE/DoxX family redox-associated membrane protein, partial [Candidatus Aquilonibacter sp.]